MEGRGMLIEWALVIQWEGSLLCPGGDMGEAGRVSWLGPRSPHRQGEFPSLACLIPTTAWNLLLGRGRLQVIRQRLPLGEADDAGDLAACSPAH